MLTTGTRDSLAAASNSLPTTIKGAIETPVVNDLVVAVGKASVCRLIEVELVKLAAAVSVGGSLDNYKVQLIATQLIEFFPYESVGDFKVCFFRASAGQYGDIFRLDGIIVRKFMEKYLEEKYEYRDKQNEKRKKEEPTSLPKPPEEGTEGYDLFKKWAEDLQKTAKQPMYTPDELGKFKKDAATDRVKMIKQNILGSKAAAPPTGQMPMTLEETEQWYRKKYPTATEEEIQRLIYTGKK